MRYLLVDRILELNAGEKIRGIKNIAMSEDFLELHFPKNPVMPGMLLVEACSQLAGWMEAASSDFQNWFLLSRVRNAKFYGFSLPGDQVELVVTPLPSDEAGKKAFSAIATVAGKKKAVAEFEGDVIAVEDYEDPEDQKKAFGLLMRP